jgi:methylmalonyl-CoA mutase
MTNKQQLFNDFKKVSPEEWKEQIIKDLKGKNYEQTLVTPTYEGINIQPTYTAADVKPNTDAPGSAPYSRGIKVDNNSWEILQHIDVFDNKAANTKALKALEAGITALQFNFKTEPNIPKVLKDILIQYISVTYDCDYFADWMLNELNAIIKDREIDASAIRGSLNYRPLGRLLTAGSWYSSLEEDLEKAANLVKDSKNYTHFRTITVDGFAINNAGANAVQEIGFALAQGNEYLAQLTSKGLSVDAISAKLQFNLSAGSNYFMEIAKLRAIRVLWAKIVEQYNPEHTCSQAMYIHSETTKWNKAMYDAHTNMLRVTTEAMSATLGGCNSLAITPFDVAYKHSDDFSERIAKNVQLILQEESYFDKIIDPAGGSYYIESLTDQLAEKAWALFQQTEAKGGFIKALKKGFIQSEIEVVANQKKADIESGKLVILGVNKHPNPSDKLKKKVTVSLEKKDFGDTEFKALNIFRAVEEIEKERLKAE